ncbi:DoxX family protein [Streptomyces armeniacus]|uniref:DoxX family protein n=1 Tax=Streptomyces armeniacus TaxID=83291 RepID=A0A345XMT7_9ACTN|nr:DoxX family protein [Streptomyces armeniacus]AXK32953.1 DoxX family protein [Streptomyces armeniacus]
MSLGDRTGGEGGGQTVGGIGPGGGGGGGGGGLPPAPNGGLRANAARYALLPLRLFLGVTFIYAGLDKLTDSAFLTGDGPGSLVEMLNAVRETAGAGWMVDLALENPEGFGYAISLGELAVGLGTLFGLWSRVAAFGGAFISLTFWLTVTWSTEPYYYGNDLAYMMAWTPLIIAGSPLLSLDAVLAVRRRRKGQHIFG